MNKNITIKEFLKKIESEIDKEKNERIVTLSYMTGMIEGCLIWID